MGAAVAMTLAAPDKTGAARMAFFFARALVQAGHPVRLLHGPEPVSSILPEMRQAGVEPVLEKGLALPIDPRLPARVASQARQLGAGAVVGVNQRDRAVALTAAHQLGLPGVVMVQNLHRFWGPAPIAALKRRYYTRVLRERTRLAVCCSQAVADQVLVEFGLDPHKTRVLPNGVEVARFELAGQKQALAAELGFEPEQPLLVTVGRLDYQKGLDVLLEALTQVRPPWQLVVVGGVTTGSGQARSQAYADSLKQQAIRAGLAERVHLVGWRDDIPRLLASADIYVHAARFEGWPLALVEAMAAGLPVVASDCVGRPQGFQDQHHGFIVPTEDGQALALALEQTLALSPDTRREWGLAGRQLARQHYDVEELAGTFVSWIEELL
ncbi:MAG: glycosyltransferase family 4 protein [Candidatus Eremiobacteraeota bacterium]|nr:glycosyltransferase family 4 protein [Candidatus Eremiobacteraeota bacterium]